MYVSSKGGKWVFLGTHQSLLATKAARKHVSQLAEVAADAGPDRGDFPSHMGVAGMQAHRMPGA